MILIEIEPIDVVKIICKIIIQFIVLMAVIGLPFWFFMVQLAEHGW